MIWYDVELVRQQEVAKDELDNPIYEDIAVKKCKARYASISKQDIDMDNRLVNQDAFKIIIKSNDFKDCNKVKVNQDSYDVIFNKQLGTRFISVFLNRYG